MLTIYILNLKDSKGDFLVNTKKHTGFEGLIICIHSLRNLFQEVCVEKKLLKYIPIYKLSQDHLEWLFGCIRLHNGCNNNHTVRQFIAALKKILIHHDLRASNTGNCVPLEHITILHGNSTK